MRRGYTLIEIIITIAITGVLAIGMFKALQAITIRSEKVKIMSTLSMDSQSALDQISSLLYNRAPMSVTGFDETDVRPYLSLDQANNKKMIEWYGLASESYQAKYYSGFADLNQSLNPTLYTPETFKADIEATQTAKWGSFSWSNSDLALIFSGTFDEGNPTVHKITMNEDNKIVFAAASIPDTIYEKYNLVDSAYAVTRKEHAASCTKTDQFPDNNTLLLFYNYRPWKGENFCDGNVTVLATDITAFRVQMLNDTIRLSIDAKRTVRGSSNPVHLSKQKVVF